jgi:uncharacterized membrane protein HdeD (DUF308 family)
VAVAVVAAEVAVGDVALVAGALQVVQNRQVPRISALAIDNLKAIL